VVDVDRVADRKAAIGYTYEDSGVAGAAGGAVDDEDMSSDDEDIDLGWLVTRRIAAFLVSLISPALHSFSDVTEITH